MSHVRKRKAMEPKKCRANTRAGTPCKNAAGFKTDHVGSGRCHLHGGATRNGHKAAKREEAVEAVISYGLPRTIDPHEALLEELHRTAGHVAWLQGKVAELEEEQLHGPVGGGQYSIPEEKPHVWVVLYQAERRHFTDVAKTCIGVGIAERQVKLAEQQGALLAQVLRGVLEEAGIADRPEIPGIVRKHLMLVDGAAQSRS